MVPNISPNPITTKNTLHNRLGRTCQIPKLIAKSGSYLTLKENSFAIRGPRLFNILPKKIRNLTKVTIDTFKLALDNWLSKIPDQPGVSGYTQLRSADNNSLLFQTNYFKND